MKIIIEVPEKSIDMAKGYLMAGCNTEEQENEICATCDKLKSSEDPFLLGTDFLNENLKGELKQLYIALVTFVVCATKME